MFILFLIYLSLFHVIAGRVTRRGHIRPVNNAAQYPSIVVHSLNPPPEQNGPPDVGPPDVGPPDAPANQVYRNPNDFTYMPRRRMNIKYGEGIVPAEEGTLRLEQPRPPVHRNREEANPRHPNVGFSGIDEVRTFEVPITTTTTTTTTTTIAPLIEQLIEPSYDYDYEYEEEYTEPENISILRLDLGGPNLKYNLNEDSQRAFNVMRGVRVPTYNIKGEVRERIRNNRLDVYNRKYGGGLGKLKVLGEGEEENYENWPQLEEQNFASFPWIKTKDAAVVKNGRKDWTLTKEHKGVKSGPKGDLIETKDEVQVKNGRKVKTYAVPHRKIPTGTHNKLQDPVWSGILHNGRDGGKILLKNCLEAAEWTKMPYSNGERQRPVRHDFVDEDVSKNPCVELATLYFEKLQDGMERGQLRLDTAIRMDDPASTKVEYHESKPLQLVLDESADAQDKVDHQNTLNALPAEIAVIDTDVRAITRPNGEVQFINIGTGRLNRKEGGIKETAGQNTRVLQLADYRMPVAEVVGYRDKKDRDTMYYNLEMHFGDKQKLNVVKHLTKKDMKLFTGIRPRIIELEPDESEIVNERTKETSYVRDQEMLRRNREKGEKFKWEESKTLKNRFGFGRIAMRQENRRSDKWSRRQSSVASLIRRSSSSVASLLTLLTQWKHEEEDLTLRLPDIDPQD